MPSPGHRPGVTRGEEKGQLVLDRKVGQDIEIAGVIVIKVLQIQGNSVKLGIAAPRSIAVHRGEVAARIRAQDSGAVDG